MTDVIVWLLLSSLASFRLAEMFVIDDGAFDMFANLRGWANNTPFDNGIKRNLANLLTCVHCTGFWFSVACGVAFYYSHPVSVLFSVLFTFAVAGLQSIISGRLGRS